MENITVAIIKSDFHGHHSGSWSAEWLRVCEQYSVPHELIDWRRAGSFEKMRKHSIVLWHYSHYSNDEMRFAPAILASLKQAGCVVFPDIADSMHFDDKVIQAYLLEALNIPAPKNYPLHSVSAVEEWVNSIGKFPVVAKLRSGSGASNVKLIKDQRELRRYSKRMFGRGYSSKPSALFKLKSNLVSSKNKSDVIARAKRVPEFLFSRRAAAGRGMEKGYVYLQEFVGGVDYDLKIVVIGDKLSFICRGVRKGDFRASGGGDLFYNREMITPELIDTAFRAAKALGSDCTGFDMICDPATSKPLILEVSYGFSHVAVIEAGCHYDRNDGWHNTPLNAPEAVLMNLIKKSV